MNRGRRWFSRKKWEQDMQDELRFHIERQTACCALRIAGDVHLLGAFWRQAQRQFRGFLRTNHDVLAPV